MNYAFRFVAPIFAIVVFGVINGGLLAQNPQTVDVDGHHMRVRVAGLEKLGGTPAIILEAGARDRIESWDPVFTQVAAFAPVLAYDRVGNGESEPDGQLPTPLRVTRKLRALLARLAIKPPYVLVGHSWGGPLIRTFAALHPRETAGLVYVDPTDMRTEEEDVAYSRAQGLQPQALLLRKAEFQEQVRRLGGEMQVIADSDQTYFAEIRALPPVPDVPVAVLMSARYDASIWVGRPCEPRRCHDVWIDFRTKWLGEWVTASTRGVFTVAPNAGHYMQRDDPALVLSTIRRIVDAAR